MYVCMCDGIHQIEHRHLKLTERISPHPHPQDPTWHDNIRTTVRDNVFKNGQGAGIGFYSARCDSIIRVCACVRVCVCMCGGCTHPCLHYASHTLNPLYLVHHLRQLAPYHLNAVCLCTRALTNVCHASSKHVIAPALPGTPSSPTTHSSMYAPACKRACSSTCPLSYWPQTSR
jgi:hypothetical protein